jgi:hypothetical protein
VQLTVRVEQSEFVIRCPDGARRLVESGEHYVVVPSPFEVDEPSELLWLSDSVLIDRARAGSWGLFLLLETPLKAKAGAEAAAQPRQAQPVAVLNGHKQIDQDRRKVAVASRRRAREVSGTHAR